MCFGNKNKKMKIKKTGPKVLVFAASTSSKSINLSLIKHTISYLKYDFELIDLNQYQCPIYSEDAERKNGIPKNAKRFDQKLTEADAIMVSFATHNFSFASAFKNTFDWSSRLHPKDINDWFKNKPVLLMGTSPSPFGGQFVIDVAKTAWGYFGASVVGTYNLKSYYSNFKDGKPIEEFDQELKEQVALLNQAISQLKTN